MTEAEKIEHRIKEILKFTERPGIEDLINYMDKNGFFVSPCSGSNHLSVNGGLAEHSYNVFRALRNTKADYYSLGKNPDNFTNDTLIIVTLLHDLGKMGADGEPYYIPNYLKSGELSTSKPFSINPVFAGIPHEVLSLTIASRFIKLTNEEYKAILWHNGLYGDFKYEISGKETPLYLLLHFADMWASRMMEV